MQWNPPPLQVVEAVVMRSVDDLRFHRRLLQFHHVAFFAVSSTNILGPFFVKTPQAMTFLRFYSKQCLHQRLQGNGMRISRESCKLPARLSPNSNQNPNSGNPLQNRLPLPPPDTVHPSPNLPQGIPNRRPNLAHSNRYRRIGCCIRMGGGARCGQCER